MRYFVAHLLDKKKCIALVSVCLTSLSFNSYASDYSPAKYSEGEYTVEIDSSSNRNEIFEKTLEAKEFAEQNMINKLSGTKVTTSLTSVSTEKDDKLYADRTFYSSTENLYQQAVVYQQKCDEMKTPKNETIYELTVKCTGYVLDQIQKTPNLKVKLHRLGEKQKKCPLGYEKLGFSETESDIKYETYSPSTKLCILLESDKRVFLGIYNKTTVNKTKKFIRLFPNKKTKEIKLSPGKPKLIQQPIQVGTNTNKESADILVVLASTDKFNFNQIGNFAYNKASAMKNALNYEEFESFFRDNHSLLYLFKKQFIIAPELTD